MNSLGPSFFFPIYPDMELPEEQNLHEEETDARFVQSITTDLATKRPDWVPQAAVSQAGTLSTKNFLYFLKHQISSQESEEALKWFFQQRKFPSTVNCDTFIIPKSISLNNLKTPVDSEGYAISFSEHGPHTSKFIEDHDILSIFPVGSIRYLDPASAIPVGIYSDHKVMIQQQGTRGCVAACAAMMMEDRQRHWKMDRLAKTNLANEKHLLSWLKQAELDAAIHEIQEGICELESFIKQHGSISCMISGELGGHAIILDQIDSNQATIREPFHGWRITISTRLFMTMAGKKMTIVYVKSSACT